MKAITEFSVFTLNKAILAKTALTAEGKSPEEIQENLGLNFKYESEKLNYLIQAIEVANANNQNLKRIIIAKLNEGEKAPQKAVEHNELHYIPEFYVQNSNANNTEISDGSNKGRRAGGKKASGPKGSPWGLSPEEKAMKNKKTISK